MYLKQRIQVYDFVHLYSVPLAGQHITKGVFSSYMYLYVKFSQKYSKIIAQLFPLTLYVVYILHTNELWLLYEYDINHMNSKRKKSQRMSNKSFNIKNEKKK